jgi:hypothetical protein
MTTETPLFTDVTASEINLLELPPGDISFHVSDLNKPVLTLKADGKILVHGKEIADDKEVYPALLEIIRGERAATPPTPADTYNAEPILNVSCSNQDVVEVAARAWRQFTANPDEDVPDVYPGYLKPAIERMLQAINHTEIVRELEKLTKERDAYKVALKSIGDSSCCEGCQEAKLVANHALKAHRDKGEQA